MKYYPFGTAISGSVDTDKKFTGQRLDSTGLYYYNARYYDPVIGRFISPDTTGQNLNDPQSLNRYTYCQNNPLNHTDPTGHANVAYDDGGWDIQPTITTTFVVIVNVTTMDITGDAGTIMNSRKVPGYLDSGLELPEMPDENMAPIQNWSGSSAVVGGASAITVADQYLYYFSPMAGGSIPVSQQTITITASVSYYSDSGTIVADLSIGTNTKDFSFKPMLNGSNGMRQKLQSYGVQKSTPSYSASGGTNNSSIYTYGYAAAVPGSSCPTAMSSLTIDLGMQYNNPYKLAPAMVSPRNIIVRLK